MNQDLTLKQLQEDIDGWVKTYGVRYFSELTNLAVLVEEVGELARIMSRKFGDQSFKDEESRRNIADELADVLFVLVCIANQTGVDLTAAFRRNLEKKTERDGERHRNNPKLKARDEKEKTMTLQEKIKKDLTEAMKAKDAVKKDALRVVLGEFGRAESKELSDKEVVRVLKKLVKSEKELLEKSGKSEDSDFIRIIETYLPQMATEEDIKAWIADNIDFSQFNNKMQAMRPIMQHFGETADGDAVKRILQNS